MPTATATSSVKPIKVPDYSGAREVREAQDLVTSLAVSEDFRVSTVVQYQDACDWLKRIKAGQKTLEALRTSITAPLNAALRACNDLFRRPAEALVQDERIIKRGLAAFEEEQDRQRRIEQQKADEAARKEQERLRAQQAKAEAAGKVEKAAALEQRAAAVAPPVIQREAPKVSGISYREVWKFEVTNPSMVPREFMVPDEKAIRGVVDSLKGNAVIAGVRIWSEKAIAAGSR